MRTRSAAALRALATRPPAATATARYQQRRTFVTSNAQSKYWMKRAKVLQIIGRIAVAYPQMHQIPNPDAPINQIFARTADERERAFMWVLSRVPPDEPINLPEFVRGASDAARTIYKAFYEDPGLLETMALPECVAVWKQRPEQIRTLVGASDAATLRLEGIEVQHAGMAEVDYTYWDAKDDEEDGGEKKTEDEATASSTTPSKFLMHETVQVKVLFDVRESIRVMEPGTKETALPTERVVAVDSSFEWTFHSDVSRQELVDWVITSVSPFTSTIAPNDDHVEDIAKDIEESF